MHSSQLYYFVLKNDQMFKNPQGLELVFFPSLILALRLLENITEMFN